MTDSVEVIVGVIGRPHGIRGEVTIDLRTDEPDRRFVVGQVLEAEPGRGLERRALTVATKRMHNGRLLITFTELVDRTAVEAARGTRLLAKVPVDQEPENDGEFYDRQLIGLRVLDSSGAEIGEIAEVLHLPAQDVLEIKTDSGPRLVPFVSELVPDVDLGQGIVRLAEVPGLLTDEDGSA